MRKFGSARTPRSGGLRTPGGANHQPPPPRIALLAKPSRSIPPQFHRPGGDEVGEPARPRKAMTMYALIAARLVKRKDAATIGMRFGRTSTRMIRKRPSPETLAASTKSRLRSDRVCARSVRALYAHVVTAMMAATSTMLEPADGT